MPDGTFWDAIDDALGLTPVQQRRATALFGIRTPPFFPRSETGEGLPAPLQRLQENPQGLFLGQPPTARGMLGIPRQAMVETTGEQAEREGLPMLRSGRLEAAPHAPVQLGSPATPTLGAPAPDPYSRLETIPPMPEVRLRDEVQLGRRPLPTDEAYKAAPLKTWQKVAGLGAAFAAGLGSRDPRYAGETARYVLGAPEREAREKYEQDLRTYEGTLGDLEKRTRLGRETAETEYKRGQTRQLEAKPDSPSDKKIDEYVNDQGQRTLIFQRPNGETYEQTYGSTREKLPTEKTETPFLVWRKQHPNADVSEYFRLQPEARADVKGERGEKPKDISRQKNLAETQKNTALRQAEDVIRRRYGLTGQFGGTAAWPEETIDELNQVKQSIQDEYETKLSNLGADVTHFGYSSQQGARTGQPGTGGKTLDRATAAKILEEAGGNKDKARRLARQRGYRF